MEAFSYSFALSLLHSTWQSALLLLLYIFVVKSIRNPHPLIKTNLLLIALLIQVCSSIFTFVRYYSATGTAASGVSFLTSIIPSKSFLADYTGNIFYAYSIAIFYKMAILVNQYFSFKKKYTSALIKPSVEMKVFTTGKAYHFGIRKKVSLWYSESVTSPVTFGFFKPIILMPFAMINQLSLAETEALIVHELTHIKHNDYIFNWCLISCETIYFFNPFIRIIASKIKLEREKTCDTQVIQFGYNAVIYAEALFKTAAHSLTDSRFQLAAVKNKSELLQRIHFFSNQDQLNFSHRGRGIIAGFLLTLMLFAHLGITAILMPTAIEKNPQLTNISTEQPIAITAFPEQPPVVITNENYIDTAASIEDVPRPENNAELVKEVTSTPPSNQDLYLDEIYPAMPVSLHTEPLVVSREVEVSEENSDGTKFKSVYRITLKDGEWITEPIYLVGEIKAAKDTLLKMVDSASKQLPVIVE